MTPIAVVPPPPRNWSYRWPLLTGWAWPLFALLAFLAFELTLEPTVAAVIMFALVTATVIEQVEKRIPGQGAAQHEVPREFMGAIVLVLLGLPVVALTSLLGCVRARRANLKFWLGSALYRARLNRTWPPVDFEGTNTVSLPLLTTWFVLTIILGNLTGIVGILAAKAVEWILPALAGYGATCVGVVTGAAVLIAGVWLTVWSTSKTKAGHPDECWGR